MEMIPSPRLGFLRGLSNQSLSKNWQLNQNNQDITHTNENWQYIKTGTNKQYNKNMLRYKTDRAWFGRLFATSDQATGLFLQLWSPHGGWRDEYRLLQSRLLSCVHGHHPTEKQRTRPIPCTLATTITAAALGPSDITLMWTVSNRY